LAEAVRGESALIGAMASVAGQAVGNKKDWAGEFGQQAQPHVMHRQACWQGQGNFQQVAPECQCAALIGVAPEIGPETGPTVTDGIKRGGNHLALGVDQFGITLDEPGHGGIGQGLTEAGDFARVPEIILIGQENDLAAAVLEGMVKIADDPRTAFISEQADSWIALSQVC